MASQQLPLPTPMDFSGNPAIEWKRWRQRFEIYLDASGRQESTDKVKISLLHALGSKGIEIYNTFTLTEEEHTSFPAVLQKFHNHFVPKPNITYQRHQFFTRNQKPDETVDQYVTDLRILSRTCEFATSKDSLIRDRMACEVADTRLTERLLRTTGLDLEKAISICAPQSRRKSSLES